MEKIEKTKIQSLFSQIPVEKIEAYLSEISNDLSRGEDKKKISKKYHISESVFDELHSIAKANLTNKKFKKKMFMNISDLRFATPEEVAYYRAYRLKCDVIVDLGCGIGGQTLPFSEVSKKVIAIELDPRKIEYAKQNASMYGRTNIEFICGDLLDSNIIKQIGAADVVFFDSERLAEETERTIASVKPDINEIIKKYSKISKNLAIEVPPQLTPEKIPFDCEREYMSFNGQLNRLTLYFGSLKRSERSVVSIPDGFTLLSDQDPNSFDASPIKNYLIEISEAVSQANLLKDYAKKFNLSYYARQKKAFFFTSDNFLQNSLAKNYSVLEACDNEFREILDKLHKHDAGSIILRASVSPQNYWDERKKYETKLKGTKKLHLFLFDDEAVIAKEI